MTSTEINRSALQRMAWLCVVLVLAITTLSAYMRQAKAGLDCEPWPQCYGQGVSGASATQPAAAAAPAVVAARLTHRIAAVAVLLLVVAMLVAALRSRPRWRADTALVAALLAVTLFLAVLGRWTAHSPLPAVVLGNLLGGFVMLALCLRLAAPAPQAAGGLRPWVWLVAALVLAQTALGGMVSATSSLLSCSGLGDCWTAAQTQSWAVLDPWRAPSPSGGWPLDQGAPLQLLHRLGAIAVLLCGLPLAIVLRRRARLGATALLACLLAQLLLGPLLGSVGAPMALVLLHNVLAATVLALLARWL